MNVAGLSPADNFMKANMTMRSLSNGRLEDCYNSKLVNDYRNYLYSILKIVR